MSFLVGFVALVFAVLGCAMLKPETPGFENTQVLEQGWSMDGGSLLDIDFGR